MSSQTPANLGQTGSPSSLGVVDRFIELVSKLNEADYGDFKRKAGLYLHQMEEGLANTSPEIKSELEAIKHFVVYRPDFRVRATQMRALDSARKIRRHL
jgi:hypothetical protein